MLNGTVLVVFTLHDDQYDYQHLRSRLVEYVSLKVDPNSSDALKLRKIGKCAFDQVRRYFEGEGKRENLFMDGPERPKSTMLSADQEADLQAELRSIELEFEYRTLPPLAAQPHTEELHPLPVA